MPMAFRFQTLTILQILCLTARDSPVWEYRPSLRYRQPRRRLIGTNCHNHRVLQAVCYHGGRFKIADIPLLCEEGNSLTSATKKTKFYSRELDPRVIFAQL